MLRTPADRPTAVTQGEGIADLPMPPRLRGCRPCISASKSRRSLACCGIGKGAGVVAAIDQGLVRERLRQSGLAPIPGRRQCVTNTDQMEIAGRISMQNFFAAGRSWLVHARNVLAHEMRRSPSRYVPLWELWLLSWYRLVGNACEQVLDDVQPSPPLVV